MHYLKWDNSEVEYEVNKLKYLFNSNNTTAFILPC